MNIETAEQLRGVLFKAYGGFGDKRLKDLGQNAPFIVDHRTKGDEDARGALYLWFCQMWAYVETHDQVRLSLRGGVPENAAVAEWSETQGGQRTGVGWDVVLTPEKIGGCCHVNGSRSADPLPL